MKFCNWYPNKKKCFSYLQMGISLEVTIEMFKAHLVARGFSQNYELDYEEMFSPVTKMVTVRSLISLVHFKGWNLWNPM